MITTPIKGVYFEDPALDVPPAEDLVPHLEAQEVDGAIEVTTKELLLPEPMEDVEGGTGDM